MADSSDLEPEDSPPHRSTKHYKAESGKRSDLSSRKPHQTRATSGQDGDVLRRHKALERICDKAQRSVSPALGLDACSMQANAPTPSASTLPPQPPSGPAAGVLDGSGQQLLLSKRVSLSMPDVSGVGLPTSHSSHHGLPEVTFTPTAAGLRA